MKHLILMSDIINSGSKQEAELMENFKALVTNINLAFAKSLISPLTITLGDEFQGLIANLQDALEIILSLEEQIIENNFNFKLRHVLVYGEIKTTINPEIAYEMLGEGLRDARYTLNNMKAHAGRFYIETGNHTRDNIMNNAWLIYQNIVDKWDIEKDHKLLYLLLTWNDYKIVAEKIGKTRSQIWKREKTLLIDSYFATKEILFTASKL